MPDLELLIPTSTGDRPVLFTTVSDTIHARVDTRSATAKSEKAAALKLARSVFQNRAEYGLVGTTRLRMMEDAQNRLDALVSLGSPTGARLAWRVRATCLGCHVPEKHGPAGWREELTRRMAAVRAYVERSRHAGPLGKPGVRYDVILADPPWTFQDRGTRAAPDYAGGQRKSKAYDTLPLAEICALGESVRAASAATALLFLWIPAALVAQGVHTTVCRAWGFEPKTLTSWVKTSLNGESIAIGLGHYTRAATEELVVATTGAADAWIAPDPNGGERLVIASKGRGATLIQRHDVINLLVSPRRKHSEKPLEQYDMINKLTGNHSRKLELFARNSQPGFDAWGYEA